jgi:hypothetical protein
MLNDWSVRACFFFVGQGHGRDKRKISTQTALYAIACPPTGRILRRLVVTLLEFWTDPTEPIQLK